MSDSLHVACPHCNTTNRVARARLEDGAVCGQCKRPLLEGRPLELDERNFDAQVKATDLPVVVDFWAGWCAPCRMMAPAFEQAAAELAPRIRLAKLDTEAAPAIASRFAIRSIPTLIAFRNGREVARMSGAVGLAQLKQWIAAHVAQA